MSIPPIVSVLPASTKPDPVTSKLLSLPGVPKLRPVTVGTTWNSTLPAEPEELFNRAYSDFSRKNYAVAAWSFGEFLRLNPDSALADDAQYWIGESYYGIGDLDQAILEFLKVRDLYPDGDKVPGATLKMGYAYLRKGQTDLARRYYQTVVREYPDSDEAELARDKLDTLP